MSVETLNCRVARASCVRSGRLLGCAGSGRVHEETKTKDRIGAAAPHLGVAGYCRYRCYFGWRRAARSALGLDRHRRRVRRRARQPDNAAEFPLSHAERRRPARAPFGRRLCRTLCCLGYSRPAVRPGERRLHRQPACRQGQKHTAVRSSRGHAADRAGRRKSRHACQTAIIRPYRQRAIDARFSPDRGRATGHDHFFAAFGKFRRRPTTISRTWSSTCSPLTARSRRNTSSS
jgi:hypothetical protein